MVLFPFMIEHVVSVKKKWNRKIPTCREGGKKYCYALGDLERLFYMGFSSKKDDCGILYHYHQNRGYVA